MSSFFWVYDFPIGKVGICESDGGISGIFFDGKNSRKNGDLAALRETPLIKSAACQLREYFDGKRRKFDLPLNLIASPFALSVYAALQNVPYGQTRSYKQIACEIGNNKACRAVGGANNRNPVAIVVPCHRIIGHNGSPVGYAGGLDIKQFLLSLENRICRGK